MEKSNVEKLLSNMILFRMDDELYGKIKNHAKKNDMSLSAIIRRSLRQFFTVEESNPGQKIMEMK